MINENVVVAKNQNIPLISHLARSWQEGNDIFFNYVSENRLYSPTEAWFMEHATIMAMKGLANNFNRNHGSTESYTRILEKNNITEDEIVKIGLAEIITHYNRHKFDIHLSTPLHLTGNRVETKYKNTLFESQ